MDSLLSNVRVHFYKPTFAKISGSDLTSDTLFNAVFQLWYNIFSFNFHIFPRVFVFTNKKWKIKVEMVEMMNQS